jgi:hypothetical protein
MKKFEKVKKALQDKTRNTADYITITKNIDCRHKGKKYAIKNVVTNNIYYESYKTLNEIIKKYELNI